MSTQSPIIFYKGKVFTAELAVRESGQRPVEKFLKGLQKKDKELCAKVLARIRLFCETGKIQNKEQVRKLHGSRLFEIKQQPVRIYACYEKGGRIILAYAFKKKQDDSLTRHETKAKKILEEHERRHN